MPLDVDNDGLDSFSTWFWLRMKAAVLELRRARLGFQVKFMTGAYKFEGVLPVVTPQLKMHYVGYGNSLNGHH